jgi:hypothetical protein
MKFLDKDHRPKSNDPNFWDVWTGKEKREIDWAKIANDWQGIKASQDIIATPEVRSEESETNQEEPKKEEDDLPF